MDFQAEPRQVSFLSDHNYWISCGMYALEY